MGTFDNAKGHIDRCVRDLRGDDDFMPFLITRHGGEESFFGDRRVLLGQWRHADAVGGRFVVALRGGMRAGAQMPADFAAQCQQAIDAGALTGCADRGPQHPAQGAHRGEGDVMNVPMRKQEVLR